MHELRSADFGRSGNGDDHQLRSERPYQLLNGRLLAGKSTVISTNLDPEELGRRYGAPLLSRLEGEYQLLPFVGTDIRRLKREQG